MPRRSGIGAPRTIEGRLREEQSAFDEILAEITGGGIRSAAHYNQLEEEANVMCNHIRAAFREYRAVHA